MREGGTQIALLVRLSMPPAVQQRIASDRASWAALTAGTHEPEPDASEMVRNRSIVDEDADRLYGDGVQHVTDDAAREEARQAFLRRVQYVDPRERRA
jgi:hypothetical protein